MRAHDMDIKVYLRMYDQGEHPGYMLPPTGLECEKLNPNLFRSAELQSSVILISVRLTLWQLVQQYRVT